MEPLAYVGAGMCALSMTVAAWGVSQVWTTIISTVGRNPQVKKTLIFMAGPVLPPLKLLHCTRWLLLWLC